MFSWLKKKSSLAKGEPNLTLADLTNDEHQSAEDETMGTSANTDSDDQNADSDSGAEADGTTQNPVIKIDNEDVITFSSAAIGQAVSMIAEDTRTFLQGMEQIYAAAAGKALAMSANSETSSQGTLMLTNITTSQSATIDFAEKTAQVASAFAKL